MACMRKQLIAKGYPISKWRELIDDWIFSETHRKIVKSWLLDDVKVDDLAYNFSYSERNIKKILTCAFCRLIEL